jgi:hypothetical protein
MSLFLPAQSKAPHAESTPHSNASTLLLPEFNMKKQFD